MAKPITWDIIDTTEAIVRALEIKGLTIDCRTPFFDVGYIAKDKTLMVNALNAEKISVLHLAHEIYHHCQNVRGELPKEGSKEEAEYADFSAWLRKAPLHKKWLHYTYDHELAAEVFGWVFAERHAYYLSKHGFLNMLELGGELAKVKHEAKLKNAAHEDKEDVEELQAEMDELHGELIKQYSGKIDNALELVLSGKIKRSEYSFKVK